MFGNVIHTAAEDMYLDRVVGMKAGIPKEAPAMTLNRLCGSGLQAILTAAQVIQTGDAEVAVAGGAESMSRGGVLDAECALGGTDGRRLDGRRGRGLPHRPVQ